MKASNSVDSPAVDQINGLEQTELCVLRWMALLGDAPVLVDLWRTETAAELLAESLPLLTAERDSAKPPVKEQDSLETAVAHLEQLALFCACETADAEGAFTIDATVREEVRKAIPETNLRAWATGALRLVDAVTPMDSDDPRRWPRMRGLLPHIETVLELAKKHEIPAPTGLLMGEKLGVFVYLQGDLARAKGLFERALAIDEAHFGGDDPHLGPDLTNLSVTLGAHGDNVGAEALITRAVTVLLPHEATHTASLTGSLTVLAGSVARRGLSAEVESLYRLAVELDERYLGPDDPFLARDLRSLAAFLLRTKRISDAEPVAERALRIDEADDPLAPSVALDLRILSVIYRQTDPTADIPALLERALHVRELWYGETHEETINSLRELADSCASLGFEERAFGYRLDILTRCLASEPRSASVIRSVLYSLAPSDDPRLATILPELAKRELARESIDDPILVVLGRVACAVLRKEERWGEARELELDIRECSLRQRLATVKDNANAWNLLGLFLKNERRDYDGAEVAYRRAVELDPEFGSAVFNLGLFLTRVQGKHAEAEPFLRRSIELEPDDAILLTGCAFFYHHELNHPDEAEPLLERAVELRPEDACTLVNLACLRILQGRNPEAHTLHERARQDTSFTATHFRTLFQSAALALLEGQPSAPWITEIKTKLAQAPVLAPWNPRLLLVFLQDHLSEDQCRFLETLQQVLFPTANTSLESTELETFLLWNQPDSDGSDISISEI